MNTLPHISHHLFAAAVAPEKQRRSRRTSRATSWFDVAAQASAIPLEVLDAARPLPPGIARQLRAVAQS